MIYLIIAGVYLFIGFLFFVVMYFSVLEKFEESIGLGVLWGPYIISKIIHGIYKAFLHKILW